MATDSRAKIVLSAVDQTGAAFLSAKRNILGLQQSAAGIGAALGPLLGTVGLLGSALSLVSFKSIVNGIDALNDLKDATGSSIENLSALEDVAARTGTSFESVGSALVKFNSVLKDAKPGSGAAETLKAIGLNAEELRRIDPAEALRQTAVALSAFSDDGNKARITQEFFSKSVKDAAPFLNDLAKQGKLNATVTTEQADAAEKFNQQLSALGKNFKDAARSIVSDMLPAINQFFEALNKGGGLSGVFKTIDTELRAKFDSAALSKVTDSIIEVQEQINKFGPSPTRVRILDQLTAQYAELQKKTTAASDALKKFAPPPEIPAAADGKPKPSAPKIPDTGGIDKARAEALANLRKLTEGRVKAIAEGLENERDEQRFGEQFSRALYAQGLQSLDKFYADQDKARQDNLAAVRKATADTIAARQAELNSPLLGGKDKQSERQEVQNQIDEARAKLRAAEREAEQQGRLSTIERQAEVQAVSEGVRQLEAQIKALQGDTAPGALLDIERQVRDAAAELRKGGATDEQAGKRAADLGTLLEAQRQLNIARDNFGKLTQRASEEEERFLIAANARGDTQAETEQGIFAIRQRALQQLGEMVLKQEELAKSAGPDSPAVQFARELRIEFERLSASVDPALQRMRAVGDEVADALGKAAGTISLNFRDARSAVKSLGDSITGILNRELVEKPLTDFFRQQIRGLTEGGGGLAGAFGKVFGVGGQGAAAGAPGGFSLAGAFGVGDAATTVPGFAGGQIDLTKLGGQLTGLGAAATGSADVLGQLPQLAAVPATVALGNLAGAAQIAASALQGIGGRGASASGASGGLLGSLFNGKGIGNLFGTSFGVQNLTGGGFGTGTDFGLQDLGLFLHRGGIAGVDGSVTRYHAGGIAGKMPNLQADEVPAILRRGEEVLTERDPRHRQNGGGRSVSVSAPITINLSGAIDKRGAEQVAAAAGRAVRNAMARGTA